MKTKNKNADSSSRFHSNSTTNPRMLEFMSRERLPPGLHSKLEATGLDFLKSSFWEKIHEILDEGIPDGTRDTGEAFQFSWTDLKCPLLEEHDPKLEIIEDDGIKGSIVMDFSMEGKWAYVYKKGIIKWTDSGTFAVSFKGLKIAVLMTIELDANKDISLFIKPNNAEVEAEDVDIKLKSKGIMTQGIINVALPHIRSMWKKPKELSHSIEKSVNENLVKIVQLLPVSYPLKEAILETFFFMANHFFGDFLVHKDWCLWQMSSIIVPLNSVLQWNAFQEEKQRESHGMSKKKADKSNKLEPTDPFSSSHYKFPKKEVPNLALITKKKDKENHICYLLSEFTLNTLLHWIFELQLSKVKVRTWTQLPHYLRQYILTFTHAEPRIVNLEASLSERPNIEISKKEGMTLTVEGTVVIAADKPLTSSNTNAKVKQLMSAPEDAYTKAAMDTWSLCQRTRHKIKFKIFPRGEQDFVARFSFEKVAVESKFEKENELSDPHKPDPHKSEDHRKMARDTMLEIIENMILVEMIPELFSIGEVGIPLAISQGCQLEPFEPLILDGAIAFQGRLRIREFDIKEFGNPGYERTTETIVKEGDSQFKDLDIDPQA